MSDNGNYTLQSWVGNTFGAIVRGGERQVVFVEGERIAGGGSPFFRPPLIMTDDGTTYGSYGLDNDIGVYVYENGNIKTLFDVDDIKATFPEFEAVEMIRFSASDSGVIIMSANVKSARQSVERRPALFKMANGVVSELIYSQGDSGSGRIRFLSIDRTLINDEGLVAFIADFHRPDGLFSTGLFLLDGPDLKLVDEGLFGYSSISLNNRGELFYMTSDSGGMEVRKYSKGLISRLIVATQGGGVGSSSAPAGAFAFDWIYDHLGDSWTPRRTW